MPSLIGNRIFSSAPATSNNHPCARPFCRIISTKRFSRSPTTSIAPRARMPSESLSQFPVQRSYPLLCLQRNASRGFNGGQPLTEDFFIKNISGMHNDELCHVLFPDWDFDRAMKFMEDKEQMFRRLASEQLKPVNGLDKLCKWIEDRGLKRAAVTNAPRPNAELMISMVGLASFFELLVIGSECERAKPFPDPYLNALDALRIAPEHAFAFEDSVSGTRAGVSAGMPVVGVATRNPRKLLIEAGATFVINDFQDPKLWGALEGLERN